MHQGNLRNGTALGPTDPSLSRRNPNRLDGRWEPPEQSRPSHKHIQSPVDGGKGNNSSENGDERNGAKFSQCLTMSALVRALSSERVYLLNRQSMSLQTFIHTSNKRVETPALLDSGATENFINANYTQYLHLPIKKLTTPRKVYNVDGTPNRKGDIVAYTDLEVWTSEKRTNMRFFITNLGAQRMILGYPWFAAMQPRIDWAKEWLDYDQLPIVIKTKDAHKAIFVRRNELKPRQKWISLPLRYKPHAKVFSEKESQWFPTSRIWDHTIDLKEGAPSTIPGKIYALTKPEQGALEEFIQEHLKKGYIKPSKSPYAAPFFFIKKKDRKLWPVQDYQKLNQWTICNRYPLPLIPELINQVKEASVFSKMDVHWGYNNVRIKEEDQWKAAFITNQGLFEPRVMFFGLTNSPATFQTMMNAIFAQELREGWITIYMDNILIHMDQNKERHRTLVHQTLQKLKENDLFLKSEKCQFEQKRIEFLEVVLENGTIQMDPTKVKVVAEWPQPQCVWDVRAFLGFTGFIDTSSKTIQNSLDH